MPRVPFCRYADDGLLHCRSRRRAEYVMARLIERFRDCGLELNPDKSTIVYCKDRNRREEHEGVRFDFLGFTFRPRRCVDRGGNIHPNFLPAISQAARKGNQPDNPELASPTPERQNPGGSLQNVQSHSAGLAPLLWALLPLRTPSNLAQCEQYWSAMQQSTAA